MLEGPVMRTGLAGIPVCLQGSYEGKSLRNGRRQVVTRKLTSCCSLLFCVKGVAYTQSARTKQEVRWRVKAD